MQRVSIIIPAYNEEKTIVQILQQVHAQTVEGFEFEVIVVDDGSRDATVALLEARPDLFTYLIRQPKNGGKGAAVLAGLQKATGDFILFQDADLEYSPSEYSALLYPVREFGAEIVMGSRFVAPKYTRVQYLTHKIGNFILTWSFNIMFNTTYTDIYTCYLLYKKSLVDPASLVSFGWEQHGEILALATKRAKIIYEVPISYHGRSYEEGKKIRWYHMMPVLWILLRRRFSG
jgi:glycosyltransferase involved in cell wall biosynthesis